tara:strand:- start:596 stop:709 length:114 start_codon:yes stop_codon:yes gene_type:complete
LLQVVVVVVAILEVALVATEQMARKTMLLLHKVILLL